MISSSRKFSENKDCLTNRDIANLKRATRLAKLHSSGGSYDMVALWSKGKQVEVGWNEISRPANSLDSSYPDICGCHAELDLCVNAADGGYKDLRGGTVYIVGKKSNGNKMRTTKPCKYCAAVLRLTRVRRVVYYLDGQIKKERVS